jgi:hypothetical protein
VVDAAVGRVVTGGPARLARQARWLRSEGVARVLEERDVHPARARDALARRRWRRHHGEPGAALAVWMVGLQRSGTNMLTRCLRRAPELEIHNEGDRRAFVDYRLRPDPELVRLLALSPHPIVLCKPLCDSHRVVELLERVRGPRGARALWVFRGVDGRSRSASARFGSHAREALLAVAAGDRTIWQGQGLGEAALADLRSIDLAELDDTSAQALLWIVRNRLFFDLGLHRRDDVALVDYDAVTADPPGGLRRVCRYIGLPYRDAMVAGVEPRTPTDLRVALPAWLRTRCDDLTERLALAAARLPAQPPGFAST